MLKITKVINYLDSKTKLFYIHYTQLTSVKINKAIEFLTSQSNCFIMARLNLIVLKIPSDWIIKI